MEQCNGTLIWHDLEPDDRFPPAAILECSECGYVCTTGNFHDAAHAEADLLRV